MCTYEGDRCICTQNMKLVCLTLWPGEVCTDDTDADANTDDDNAGRRHTTDKACSSVDKTDAPKSTNMNIES